MEREGLFNRYMSKKINVEHVPTEDCLFGVIAMAFNVLAVPSKTLTGIDVQRLSERANIPKGELEALLKELGRERGTKELGVVHFPETGSWTKENVYNLFTEIIDKEGLVFVGVDSNKWYKLFGFASSDTGQPHAILANGYEHKQPKYFGTEEKNIILQDPNFKRGIKVEFDLLYPAIWPKYNRKFGVVAFFQKGNPSFAYTQ